MILRKVSAVCTFMFILAMPGIAQPTPKKPGTKTPAQKPPTNKEMQALMKEAQQALDELSPEDKRMMDSLGIKRPDFKNVPAFSDKQLKEAYTNEARLVPKKNPALIASVNKKPMSDAELKAFISKTRISVEKQLTPVFNAPGQMIYDSLKKMYPSDNAVAVAATGLWLTGNPEIAIYLMGKSCEDRPTDADNLNNYAAFLSMLGGDQYSLPISYTLNAKYPNNSTILNNIGQAWYGLGDLDMAMRYLDSAIMIYPRHSQANKTESIIEDYRGHPDLALAHLMKSLNEAFSEEKLERIKKHGGKVKASDISWNLPIPNDVLGLSHYKLPPFPMKTSQVRSYKADLDQFYEDIRGEIQDLISKSEELEKKAEEKDANANIEEDLSKGLDFISKNMPGPLFAKASFLLEEYNNDPTLSHEHEMLLTDLFNTVGENAAARAALPGILEKAGGTDFDTDQSVATCRTLNSEFLLNANSKLQDNYSKYLNFEKARLNKQAYFMRFMATDDFIDAVYPNHKAGFLSELIEFQCEYLVVCPPDEIPLKKWKGELPDFDVQRNDTLAYLHFGKFFEMRVMANRTYTKWDISVPLPNGLSVGLKGEIVQNDNKRGIFGVGRITNGTLEFGASMGTGNKIEAGPAKAEGKISGGGFIEANEDQGITDIGVKAGVSIKSGIGDKDSGLGKSGTVIGMESKLSWNISKNITKDGALKGGSKLIILK